MAHRMRAGRCATRFQKRFPSAGEEPERLESDREAHSSVDGPDSRTSNSRSISRGRRWARRGSLRVRRGKVSGSRAVARARARPAPSRSKGNPTARSRRPRSLRRERGSRTRARRARSRSATPSLSLSLSPSPRASSRRLAQVRPTSPPRAASCATGDGLRCAGGSVIRLGTKTNAGNASSYPVGRDIPVSVRGQIPSGGSVRSHVPSLVSERRRIPQPRAVQHLERSLDHLGNLIATSKACPRRSVMM